jgi:hypothetical protein
MAKPRGEQERHRWERVGWTIVNCLTRFGTVGSADPLGEHPVFARAVLRVISPADFETFAFARRRRNNFGQFEIGRSVTKFTPQICHKGGAGL